MFDPNLEMIITTDSSSYGLGGVLSQINKDRVITIACASRTLSEAECNYPVGDKWQ